MNYREALSWIYKTQQFGIKLGLDNINRLLDSLGLSFPIPGERIIHIAGTNGKGSVAAMLDAICRAGRYHTGLFTSPHLVTFRERIRVNGRMILEEEVARGLTNLKQIVSKWEPHPTFFELTTALALDHFRRAQTEIIVLETGLGGRLDATNAVIPTVCVVTPIDYDHQKWLGSSLTSIASEKAGIIKTGIPVVSAMQPPEASAVLCKRAKDCGAPLTFVTRAVERFPIALAGAHQRENAALALESLEQGEIKVSAKHIGQGLATVEWPARFQLWDERTIIDGAHNPAGAQSLASTWRERFGKEHATLILGLLADKDALGICTPLLPLARNILLSPIQSERALKPDGLASLLKEHFPDLTVGITESFTAAWRKAQSFPDRILITGSLHFAGEALASLQGKSAAYEECLQ